MKLVGGFEIPTQDDVRDDMAQIHALHVAHGDKRHCNYCDCQCTRCKAEGWKYRPVPYVPEFLPFVAGETLRVIEPLSDIMDITVGDEVVYMGNRRFKVTKGSNKGASVTFFANVPCEKLFQRTAPLMEAPVPQKLLSGPSQRQLPSPS